jgi:hypothetical protein
MRMCPKCRLVTADDRTCAECGWNPSSGYPASGAAGDTFAERLKALTIFSAVMFVAAFAVSLSVTRGDSARAALAGGLFGTGLIADLFLVRLIYRAAELYQEAQRWTVGALLTFPFGTLVFAWLLARRLRHDKPLSPLA